MIWTLLTDSPPLIWFSAHLMDTFNFLHIPKHILRVYTSEPLHLLFFLFRMASCFSLVASFLLVLDPHLLYQISLKSTPLTRLR